MKHAKIIALAIGSLGFATMAWAATSEPEGEPAEPIRLPDEEDSINKSTNNVTSNANELEALARVIASEAGSGTDAEKRCIGWTVRNRFRGKSIYAQQFPWRAQKGSDPPFSSARPATESSRKMAEAILSANQSEDPTHGATAFFEPRMQDIFAKAGALARSGETGDRVIDGQKLTDITRFKAYKKSADDIRKSWSNGSALYATAGRFEFWGKSKRGLEPVLVAGLDYYAIEG